MSSVLVLAQDGRTAPLRTLPVKPTEEDIRGYIMMRLQKDPELDAMDAELEAEIIRIIPERISEAYVTSVDSQPKVLC